MRVLFDGFDEVPSDYRRSAIKIITKTYNDYGSQCIVTTRPGTDIQLYGGEVHNYTLMDLTTEDVIKIINNHALIQTQDKIQLVEVISTKESIAKILLTPIIVDIFISTYNSLVSDPTTIIDFYDELFLALSSAHDRLKVSFAREGLSGLKNRDLQKVFQTASFRLLVIKNEITHRENEIEDAFDYATKKLGFETGNTHLDVINKTSLILQDGQEFSYIHKSIFEFYAAKHIQSLSDESRIKYYNTLFNDYNHSHENVLKFLSKIDSDLFYINFVSLILNEIKLSTSLYDDSSKNRLTLDVFYILYRVDTVMIESTDERKTWSIKPVAQLDNIRRNILIAMLFNILEVSIYSFISDPFKFIKISDCDEQEIINRMELVEGDNKEERVYRCTLKLNDLLNLDDIKHRVVIDSDLEVFFKSLYDLDNEVKSRQKIYDYKNALDQFC